MSFKTDITFLFGISPMSLLLLQKTFICLEETVLLSDMLLVGFFGKLFGYFIKAPRVA
jgi:hypothetical protein